MSVIVSVSYGVHRLSDLAMVGKTVAEIRSGLQIALNIDLEAKCVVNGKDVDDDYVAKANDRFEFVVKVKLIKTVDRAYVEMGDVITYQVSVQNQVTAPLRDFHVLDRLPQGFVFTPGTANYVIDPGESHPLQPVVKGPELTFQRALWRG